MEQSQDTKELEKALDSFHGKSNLVKATKENPFLKNKYVDYNTVVAVTKPELLTQGLTVKQAITHIDGRTAIYTRLKHVASGEWFSSIAPVAHKESDPQSQGSGITYMKRYSYIAMLDLLVDSDDDGNLAAGLGKVAEKKEAVEKAIATFSKATSEEELKKAFIATGNLMNDKRVVAAKDARKAELDI